MTRIATFPAEELRIGVVGLLELRAQFADRRFQVFAQVETTTCFADPIYGELLEIEYQLRDSPSVRQQQPSRLARIAQILAVASVGVWWIVLSHESREQSERDLLGSLRHLEQTLKTLLESEKLASLGGLVAGVAHEINTPVGIAVSTASYLSDRTQDARDLSVATYKRTNTSTRFTSPIDECCICERVYEVADMAHCPFYRGPLCSLCCGLDLHCHDFCKRPAAQQNDVPDGFVTASGLWRPCLAPRRKIPGVTECRGGSAGCGLPLDVPLLGSAPVADIVKALKSRNSASVSIDRDSGG